MTTAIPTFSQIKAQVAAVRRKIPQASVIGIRATGRWTGESLKPDGGQAYWIRQCDSPLAMRLALREEIQEGAIKVLITSLADQELGDDILIRLTKRHLYPIDSWQIVRSLFQAHAVDPRLTRLGWLADKLLDLAPPEGYPLARGGFLDAETVWPLLLGRAIGMEGDTYDLPSLLKWSLSADGVAKFQRLEEHFRTATIAWLAEQAGLGAEAMLRCVARLERPDALALGLAAGVVFHPATAGRLERSIGKFEERYFAGETLELSAITRWSAAATEVVRHLGDSRVKRQQLQRADEILSDVQAEGFAHLSDTSPLGFDQRLARFGSRLVATLEDFRSLSDFGSLQASIGALGAARQAIRGHESAGRETRRLERAEMALRLVRWFVQPKSAVGAKPQSLAEAAAEYLGEGSYVDWARLALRAGEPVRELSEAYARLFEEVTKIREAQSQYFAMLLRDWTVAGSLGDEVLGVERILERIVAPLAAESAVLVIVIDGMSAAVYRELLADVTRHDWVALAEPGRSFNRPGIATIPSVTEASRTSLLCGRLRPGSAADEKTGFAEQAALLAQCRSGYPPVLFHKASLQESEDAVLAAEVRKEIASRHRKIVGVVVNAVDDHLLKGEQIDTRWSRDEIKVLPALFHEARLANRVVVLLSDHGHVLDCQSHFRAREGGERWRIDLGEPESDELRIAGSRVVIPESKTLIAPWSEKLRYGIKKNGYHGGVSPQEMVVPIAVLARSSDIYPAGWHEAHLESPLWWDELAEMSPVREPIPKLKPAKPHPAGMLFDLQGEEAPAIPTPAVAPANVVPEWISRLLSSPVFEGQKRLGGRAVPSGDIFSQLLAALDGRGGTMTSAALARVLSYPPLRLNGMLAVVQRVLNVDGYQVLSRDEASETVELNRELLLKQFDL